MLTLQSGIQVRFLRPVAVLLIAGFVGSLPAEEAKPTLNEQEQAFVELLTNATLAGSFTMGDKDKLSAERYAIRGVRKIKDDRWQIDARIVYGQLDVVVPVPVQVHWALDTPILSVRKLTLPLVGEGFEARLLFENGRYAGTWSHGPIGGHLFGKVEHEKE